MFGGLYLLALIGCGYACPTVYIPQEDDTTCHEITTGSPAATVTYDQTQLANLHYPQFTTAVITCSGLGSTTLLTLDGTTKYTGSQQVTCVAGAWSTTGEWACPLGCSSITTTDTSATSITYNTAQTSGLNIAGETAAVNCATSGRGTTRELYAGTSTTAVSGTADVTLTCQSTGDWQDSTSTTQTTYNCYSNCHPPSVLNADATFENFFTTITGHGSSETVTLLAATVTATIPCDSDDVTHVVTSSTGASETFSTADTTLALTCANGYWTATINGVANSVVYSMACV